MSQTTAPQPAAAPLCPTCQKNPAEPPHACPYAFEIGGVDDDEYCTCCDHCRHECAMDI